MVRALSNTGCPRNQPEKQMSETINPPSTSQLARIAKAASITAAQLEEAEEIVKSRMPGLAGVNRPLVIAAVLQAVAANYRAAMPAIKR